jgi:hypothetical protein
MQQFSKHVIVGYRPRYGVNLAVAWFGVWFFSADC